MIDPNTIFDTQFFLLALMAVGYLAVKTGLMDERGRTTVTNLVLCVFLPCSIFSSFIGSSTSQLYSWTVMLVISIGLMVFSYVLGRFVFFRFAGEDQKKVLLFVTLVPNAAFVGNPVIEHIFGFEALTFAAAYHVPMWLCIWIMGAVIFSKEKINFVKTVLHPCLLGSYLGLILMISGLSPPPLASRLLSSLASCTTPVSMIVVGAVLALLDHRQLFSSLGFYFSAIRLLIMPLLILGILLLIRPFLGGVDPLVISISVIFSGTPAGITATILADKYNGDRFLASKVVFLSTLASCLTIPALVFLIQFILA